MLTNMYLQSTSWVHKSFSNRLWARSRPATNSWPGKKLIANLKPPLAVEFHTMSMPNGKMQ